jgi:hypothetical protein
MEKSDQPCCKYPCPWPGKPARRAPWLFGRAALSLALRPRHARPDALGAIIARSNSVRAADEVAVLAAMRARVHFLILIGFKF